MFVSQTLTTVIYLHRTVTDVISPKCYKNFITKLSTCQHAPTRLAFNMSMWPSGIFIDCLLSVSSWRDASFPTQPLLVKSIISQYTCQIHTLPDFLSIRSNSSDLMPCINMRLWRRQVHFLYMVEWFDVVTRPIHMEYNFNIIIILRSQPILVAVEWNWSSYTMNPSLAKLWYHTVILKIKYEHFSLFPQAYAKICFC